MIPILAAAGAGLLAGLGATAMYVRRRRRQARAAYQDQLERALADGILTPEEIEELATLRAQQELSEAEVRMVALAIYRRALAEAASDERITDTEEARLGELQRQLGLSELDLRASRQQMQRLRLLGQVDAGRLPELQPPFPLAPGERCHWVVRASLCEPLVLRRGSHAEPEHLQFALASDQPYRTDGSRGALEPHPEILPIDLGMAIVTSRRTIYRGAKRRLSLPHARLRTLALYRDAIRLDSADGRTYLLVEDAELTAGILLLAARRRRAEIGGPAPARSA